MLRYLLWGGAAVILAAGPVYAERNEVRLDVLYGPTPPAVVDQMLAVAGVCSEDRLFDLGCGDGRIAIAAAKQAGASCVGIDIDPKRIEQSIRNARAENVTGRVRFYRKDLFKVDLRKATVVAIFLNAQTNLRLRPKLLRELAPGSRIVSHKYSMAEWEPDKVVNVGDRRVYSWVVPANVSGTWEITMPSAGKGQPSVLHVDQHFQKLNGMLSENGRSTRVAEIAVDGARFRMLVERDTGGTGDPVCFEGAVKNDRITGAVQTGGTSVPWSARRVRGTAVTLDRSAP